MNRPDVIVIMTDEERAAPSYESAELTEWRRTALPGRQWFDEHAVSFGLHYTGSLACVPSRPTIFTGHYPDVHGVTQTDGLAKLADDSRMRWLRPGEVPTLGSWFREAGYDTHYDGKWHISHADLIGNDGEPLATNDDDGTIDPGAIQAYTQADRLDEFGFSGWIGPEPHGGKLANSGVRRDPLIADRVCAWLKDRYERRRVGEQSATRPFLLIASFVNPHDIVLLPQWLRLGFPTDDSLPEPPPVPASPTDDEDLLSKPDVQSAYRDAYVTAYGPAELVAPAYADHTQQYRDLYYQLHAEVDDPIDRVRRAVTDSGSTEAVVVRTSDHGELLGSHGGLHQKWFTLYDEATRVPFQICRLGASPSSPAVVDTMPTSHVDLVPTLLAAAGIDENQISKSLKQHFSEVHPLPGQNLMPIVCCPGAILVLANTCCPGVSVVLANTCCPGVSVVLANTCCPGAIVVLANTCCPGAIGTPCKYMLPWGDRSPCKYMLPWGDRSPCKYMLPWGDRSPCKYMLPWGDRCPCKYMLPWGDPNPCKYMLPWGDPSPCKYMLPWGDPSPCKYMLPWGDPSPCKYMLPWGAILVLANTCCPGISVVLANTCCPGVSVVLSNTCFPGAIVVLANTCCPGVSVVLANACCPGVSVHLANTCYPGAIVVLANTCCPGAIVVLANTCCPGAIVVLANTCCPGAIVVLANICCHGATVVLANTCCHGAILVLANICCHGAIVVLANTCCPGAIVVLANTCCPGVSVVLANTCCLRYR